MFRLSKVVIASAIAFLGTVALQARESGDRSMTPQFDKTAPTTPMADIPYDPETSRESASPRGGRAFHEQKNFVGVHFAADEISNTHDLSLHPDRREPTFIYHPTEEG